MADTILVTGGTGYIGGELIDQALAAGKTVHTTVRNLAKSEPRLRARWPAAGKRLKVFWAELESDDGWEDACEGCDGVAHVASPFPLTVPDHADELVIPARDGALRALENAYEAGAKRFVLTSSAAAIAYGHPPGKSLFTEADWTVLENPDVQPYHRSKTVAEKACRDWVSAHAPDMEFCSINPVVVVGPVASDDLSTSVALVQRLLTGKIPALPDVGVGIVDVRDVARAHLLALDAPAQTVKGGRFAVSDRFMWMSEIAEVIRERTPAYAGKVPSRRLPSFMVRLLAPFMADLKQVKTELGRHRDVSGRHATDVLGLEYIPAAEAIEATVRSLVDRGIVKF
ncbi:NAD-dependent epimerase/dehydratase family protein [Erythrobacter sp. JK5]|uniref:NAD-dependent epimerase/dehydratase family protein n=1 Tax=Erythrobacter sp. JK5 TaxID=2829500 RepID=UPI001BA63F5A|nr:NAD-dependent epimerase/dehydratase family protein [Erythrobacter sp. JK5]QUL38935.1 NAD-dependent epimerase/dehydratase family protein [Erythrobacter sp. JK5]